MKILVCLVIFVLSNNLQAKLVCENLCPYYQYWLDETFFESGGKYFRTPGPADGICPSGVKHLVDGTHWGYPGQQRCVCVIVNSKYDATCPSDNSQPQCMDMLPMYSEQTMGEYFKRTGRVVGENATEDGCCPEGGYKYQVAAADAGISHDMCYCINLAETPLIIGKYVTCLPVVYYPNETVIDAGKRNFGNPGPEDGVCEYGVKFISDGADYGYPGVKRCFCFNVTSKYDPVCPLNNSPPQCMDMLPIYSEESLADYFKRIGRTIGENATEDGCCPAGSPRFQASAADVGLSHDVCYCVSQNDFPVVTGKPEDDDSSSGESVTDSTSSDDEITTTKKAQLDRNRRQRGRI